MPIWQLAPEVLLDVLLIQYRVMQLLNLQPHLIRLGDVGKDSIHHAHQHTILERVSRVLDDGDDVGTGLGHVDQVSSGTVGKLYRVHASRWSHDVRHVRNSCSGGCSKVEHLKRYIIWGQQPNTFVGSKFREESSLQQWREVSNQEKRAHLVMPASIPDRTKSFDCVDSPITRYVVHLPDMARGKGQVRKGAMIRCNPYVRPANTAVH